MESENKDFYHTFDGGFQNKKSRINLTNNRMTRTKVKFQLDKNHLDLISSVFNWIITTN